MKILTVTKADIEELAKVEIESKLHSIPECIDDFEIDYSSRLHRWQTYFDGISPQTSKPERKILKAVDEENKIVGYIAAHLTTRFNIHAEIQSFYILKEKQQQGVGTLLLKEIIQWLISLNAKTLCVGIKPENKYKAFYLKHGGQYLNEHWIIWKDIHTILRQS
jgi:GNAT superfamily N-acetyltransferase